MEQEGLLAEPEDIMAGLEGALKISTMDWRTGLRSSSWVCNFKTVVDKTVQAVMIDLLQTGVGGEGKREVSL